MAKSVWGDPQGRAPVWVGASAVLDVPRFRPSPTPGDQVKALLGRLEAHGVPEARHRALVVGAGDGVLTEALAGHFGEVVGVDLIPAGRPTAHNVELIQDTAGDLSAIHGRFDLILCPYVLGALPTSGGARFLLRLLKHLSGDGTLVLTVLSRRTRIAQRALARAAVGAPGKALRTISAKELGDLVARSGLELVASEQRSGRYGTRVLEGIVTRVAEGSARVIEGSGGWLFLDRDRNRVIAQHSGELLLTPDELDEWAMVLGTRTKRLQSQDGRYVHLVPPDPHAVWAERLPPSVPRAQQRPLLQLVERLGDEPVEFVYPLERLRAEREGNTPYSATDTHWTAYGAWIGYQALLDALCDRPPARRLTADDVVFTAEKAVGDLGNRVDPPRASTQVRARVVEPRAELLEDNRVRNNGRIIRFRCDAAPDASLLILGDSFTYAMLRFLSETWRRVTFVHLYTLDPDLLEQERPDVVVTVLNERFHIKPPVDDGAMTAQDWYRRKAEQGGVMSASRAEVYSRKLGWP